MAATMRKAAAEDVDVTSKDQQKKINENGLSG